MPRPNRDAELAECFGGCLATSVRLLARAIAGVYDEGFRELGLRSTQVTLLANIAALAGPDGVTQRDLARPMHIDQSTLSRNLALLLDRGLIRAGASEDRRLVPYSLTPLGRSALRAARPVWMACQERVEGMLGSDAQALRRAAARMAK